MVGAPIDTELARQRALDAAEDAGDEALRGGVGVDERLLKLPETVAIAPEGGVLVPQLLILAEELAVLFLQAVEIADVAEEVRDGTERRRVPSSTGPVARRKRSWTGSRRPARPATASRTARETMAPTQYV